MTPERKRFLAEISREERVIRANLDKAKLSLRIAKKNAFRYGGRKPPEELAGGIKHKKIIIKALKKQLSQNLVYVSANEDNIHWCLNCPACHYTIVPSNFTMSFFRNYCPNCGQKLR